MKFVSELKEKYDDFILDRPILKILTSDAFMLLGTVIAAFLLAFTYRALVSPTATIITSISTADGKVELVTSQFNLIAGGVSGFGQVVILFFDKIGFNYGISHDLMQSIIYFVVNIPLFTLAFFCIGKKFAIYSAINVLLTSIFIATIPQSWTTIFSIQNDLLARAVFAGVTNGLAISIAVELHHSTGGTDIISMYFALKKGIAIGKYVLIINTSIVLAYTILSSISTPSSPGVHGAATMALYTLIFFFTSSVVIDHVSTRNKKVQLQIVTTEPRLSKLLIQHFPHGCTTVDGKGAFFDQDKKIIFTVISSFELKKATRLIYKIDPHAFVTVNNAYRVYGKFFIRPIK